MQCIVECEVGCFAARGGDMLGKDASLQTVCVCIMQLLIIIIIYINYHCFAKEGVSFKVDTANIV